MSVRHSSSLPAASAAASDSARGCAAFHISSRTCAPRARLLYAPWALPVFAERTALGASTKRQSCGIPTRPSGRIGTKANAESCPDVPARMAAWSSLPPCVPTPASPASVPNDRPFSMQAK